MHTCSEHVYIADGISTGYCGIRVGGPKLDKQNTQARVCIPTPECFQVLQGVHANSGGYTGGYEPIPEHVLVVQWRCHVEISLEYVQLLWSMHTFSEECIHTLEYLYLHLRSVYTDCIQIAITPQSGGSSTLTPQSEGNSAVRSLCRVESNRHTLQRVDGTMYALRGAHAK